MLTTNCATTEDSTTKKDEGLHLADSSLGAKFEALREKYGITDSVNYITDMSLDDIDSLLKALGDLQGSDTTYNEDGTIKEIKTFNPINIDYSGEDLEDIGLDISPNPTSSSVTLKFFTKVSAEYKSKMLPKDLTVDLYYLDQKVHTFNFPNSYGEEIIPEQYLQKDGSYRVVLNGTSVPFMVRKN